MEEHKLVVLLDGVSRTIAGVKVSETDDVVVLQNPVVVNAVPTPEGQMSLQLIPLFFREILLEKNVPINYHYRRANITMTDIDALEPQIESQYADIFKDFPVAVSSPAEGETSNVVELFPDEGNNNG